MNRYINNLRYYSSERREVELSSSLDTINEGMRISTLPDIYHGKDIYQTFNILSPTTPILNNINLNLPSIYLTTDVIHSFCLASQDKKNHFFAACPVLCILTC
jgi:hypothetical protein